MPTTAIPQPQPEVEQPHQRLRSALHNLVRRNIRLIEMPRNPEEQEQRRVALVTLDRQAHEYNEFKGIAEEALKNANELKPAILGAVERMGAVPDSAPKSKRVETESFVCTGTTGTTMEIVDEEVLRLDLAMSTKRDSAIFDQLFVRQISYTLAPTAHQLIKHGKLPKAIADTVREQYVKCFSAKTTSTSLTVESKDELAQKQRAAAAAAEAKAAKKKGVR